MQQDALNVLIKTIHPTKTIDVKDVLKDVREARNASIGHSTQLKRKGVLSAHGIVQVTMSKDGFDLFSFPGKDDKLFDHIPVRELTEKQREEAIRILSEVVSDLREQEEAHRTQFREIKIKHAFDQVSYAFEKIFEEVCGSSIAGLGSWGIDHLRKSLDQFEKLLKERGLRVDSYASIKYLYEEIEHPLTELRKFIAKESSEILSDKSAVVFARALQSSFDELRRVAGEIDDEYSSVSESV